jgi:hypothetical protein
MRYFCVVHVCCVRAISFRGNCIGDSSPAFEIPDTAGACGRLLHDRGHLCAALQLVDYPASFHQQAMLSFIKNQNVEMGDLIPYFVNNLQLMNEKFGPAIPKYAVELSSGNWCMNVISGTLMAECISQAASVGRQRVYVAVFLSQIADVIPTVLLTLVQTLITFSYMPDT